MSKGTIIMRFVGNRQQPEENPIAGPLIEFLVPPRLPLEFFHDQEEILKAAERITAERKRGEEK